MGSPPPPPAHHGQAGGRTSSYSIHSPRSSGVSFRDDYVDMANTFTNMGINDRRGSRPMRTRTTSSASSSANKNFIYYLFQREGKDWYEARKTELTASQGELKKRVERKSKTGPALEQMEKMGYARCELIKATAAALDEQEVNGSSWEPAFIETKKIATTRDGAKKVTEFIVIFARRAQRPVLQERRQSRVTSKAPAKESPVAAQKTAEKPKPKDQGPVKSVKYAAPPNLDDTFSSANYFTEQGDPIDAQGPVPFHGVGLPIRREVPIGQMPPKEEPLPAALPALTDGDVDLDAMLDGIRPGDPEGLIDFGEDLHRRRSRRDSQHARFRSHSKRRHSAQRSADGALRPLVETRTPEWYGSSRSSWASDGASLFSADVDDWSSKTSDEIYDTYVRNPIIDHHKARRQSSSRSGRKYYRELEKLVIPERHQSRAVQVEPQRQITQGREEQFPRQNTSQRPMVHQPSLPRNQGPVPPTAEYPSFYAGHHQREESADDYMRKTIREEDYRAREAELARREREASDRERRNAPPGNGYYATSDHKKYNYEPREQYYRR